MTIGMLKRDFKEIAGYDIPYAHFGFKSLEHYLRSIPDTVQVCYIIYSVLSLLCELSHIII